MSVLHRLAPHRRRSLRRLTADSLAVTMVGGEPVHRGVSNTLCPGDVVYTRPRQLRTEVRARHMSAGAAFSLGNPDDFPLMCDWDDNGTDTPGVFRRWRFYVRNDGPDVWAFAYGKVDDVPLCGDWEGNGSDTVGVKRGGIWYLRNRTDTVGVKRRGGTWYLRNRNTTGIADLKFDYGVAEDVLVTGDWDGSGTDDAGFRRGITWYLRD